MPGEHIFKQLNVDTFVDWRICTKVGKHGAFNTKGWLRLMYTLSWVSRRMHCHIQGFCKMLFPLTSLSNLPCHSGHITALFKPLWQLVQPTLFSWHFILFATWFPSLISTCRACVLSTCLRNLHDSCISYAKIMPAYRATEKKSISDVSNIRLHFPSNFT